MSFERKRERDKAKERERADETKFSITSHFTYNQENINFLSDKNTYYRY